MGRNTKPACTSETHRYTKEQKEKMDIVEREFSKYYDEVTTVPDVIKDDSIAVQYYNFLVDNILKANLPISNVDIPLLIDASFSLSQVYRARKDIIHNGTTEDKYDKNGNFMGSQIRAVVKIEQTYSEKYLKISSKIGLDPTSRATIARSQIIDMEETDDGLFE